MAVDYAEKERTFVSELKADTGRDLQAWMNAISKANLPHRNDVIDWLREQGFTFANASWLERIHANGGRLIYADDPDGPAQTDTRTHLAPERQKDDRIAPNAERPLAEIIVFTPAGKPIQHAPTTAPISKPHAARTELDLDDAVEALLSNAKGLRPLALFALREVLRILPETRITADGPMIALFAPRRYLSLLPAPKALRIYGDFLGAGGDRVARAEPTGHGPTKLPPPFPASLFLSDARLVDATFAEIVKTAARRAHS